MQETNRYGDISGGFIFDQMDRYAHGYAVSEIGDCITASASINYFKKVSPGDKMEYNLDNWFAQDNKIQIIVSLVDEWRPDEEFTIYATASFLFIKKK